MSMQKDLGVAGMLGKVVKVTETWGKDIIINAIKCKESTGQPCTCNALVKCTSAEDKDETVHIVKEVLGTNIMISNIGQLGENDITRERVFTGCKCSLDKLCTLEEKYIVDRKWQETYEGAELNDEEGVLDVESSYMVCTYGDGILFFEDAGQMVRTYGTGEVIRVEEYVTLEMLDISGKMEKLSKELEELEELEKLGMLDDFGKQEKQRKQEELEELKALKNLIGVWEFREIISYNTGTSLPKYRGDTEVRDIAQEDVDEINRVLNIYGINTPERIAHFLAQSHVETGGGYALVEQYEGDNVLKFFEKYETEEKRVELGNSQKGDGALYRGAGAVQITGRAAYEAFSKHMNDSKISSDGALYVGQNYFWEAGAFYWSVYKPNTAGDDRFNLNKWCDENADVGKITEILNGDESDKLAERT